MDAINCSLQVQWFVKFDTQSSVGIKEGRAGSLKYSVRSCQLTLPLIISIQYTLTVCDNAECK